MFKLNGFMNKRDWLMFKNLSGNNGTFYGEFAKTIKLKSNCRFAMKNVWCGEGSLKLILIDKTFFQYLKMVFWMLKIYKTDRSTKYCETPKINPPRV